MNWLPCQPHSNSAAWRFWALIPRSKKKCFFISSPRTFRKSSRYKGGGFSSVVHRSALFRNISYQLKSMHCLKWSGGVGYSCWRLYVFFFFFFERGLWDIRRTHTCLSLTLTRFPGSFVLVELHIALLDLKVTSLELFQVDHNHIPSPPFWVFKYEVSVTNEIIFSLCISYLEDNCRPWARGMANPRIWVCLADLKIRKTWQQTSCFDITNLPVEGSPKPCRSER